MNLFEQYGIKEVADVTLYSIHKKQDGSGDLYYVPAIYFDTLKVSTIEKTGESTWAEGGLGNERLINWDYGKTINISLEDALCTPASLGLCWDGVLSADWKDGKIDYRTNACECLNPLAKVSRMEKVFYPRDTRGEVTVSNLLPQIKGDDFDDYFGLLKISSVVDGTDIRGFGTVRNKTYKWRMAIESAVKSIAIVPDRFFDIKGKAYSIDWNRKVSVNSLPTVENCKDAIIYRINNRGKCLIPPMAKIIFDESMSNTGTIVDLGDLILESEEEISSPISLGKALSLAGYTLYEEGYFSITENDETTYYIPFESFNSKVIVEYDEQNDVYYVSGVKAYQLNENGIATLLPPCRTTITADYFENTLVTYLQNHAHTNTPTVDTMGSVVNPTETCKIEEGHYLAIVVDNNDNYLPFIGKITDVVSDEDEFASSTVTWYKPAVDINVSQFKGIDMWIRFDSINEMIYFLITKYEDNIISINPATIKALNKTGSTSWAVDNNYTTVTENDDNDSLKAQGKLWAYVNPNTMQPYDDDYWFTQGESYYVKSLTLAPENKKLKGQKIIVRADQWPGMYMFVGETWLRNRDTGKDERLQIRIPAAKIKADQTLTLEAAGDPVVFSMSMEVAKPKHGRMMEITAYEIGTKMVQGENGCYYAVDGSSEVLSE